MRTTDIAVFRIAAQLLELAADDFSNHGCNDLELDNTPDNLAFVRGMIAASDDPGDVPQLGIGDTSILVSDFRVMRHLATRLEEIAARIDHVRDLGKRLL